MQSVAHRPLTGLSEIEAACLPLVYDVNRLSEHNGVSREAILLIVKQLSDEWYGVEKECPSNSGEGVTSRTDPPLVPINGSQTLAYADIPPVALPRRRETQPDALRCNSKEKMNWIVMGDDSKLPQPSFSDKTGIEQPSGNGVNEEARKPRSLVKLNANSSVSTSRIVDHPAVDKAVIPSQTPPFDLFSVEVMPRRARTVDDAAIDSEIPPLRERVLDALSRLEDCEIGAGGC